MKKKRAVGHNTRLGNRIKNENPGGFGTRNTFDSGMTDEEKRAVGHNTRLGNRIKQQNPWWF